MESSSATLIRRIFHRRYGIAVRKVGVRSEPRWIWRAGMWALILSVFLAGGGWVYDAGRRYAGFDRKELERELAETSFKLGVSLRELTRATESARAAEVKLQVESAALSQVALQLNAAQRDVMALKEELALFEGLIAGAAPSDGSLVRVPKLLFENTGQGRYRYRMLVVHQSSQKSAPDFSGEYRFELKVRMDGRDVMMVVPTEGKGSGMGFKISVRHIHRAEGEVTPPAGAIVMGGEVILSQAGSVKARQTISLQP